MKILEISIFNFGKFSNFNLKFDDKLHIIDEPNGYGKTTIAQFINAMFYGLPNMQVKDISNKRIKYAPWNRGNYGGSLIFLYKDKKYQITREFGYDTISSDTFKLINYETGILVNSIDNEKIDGKNLGEVLFKINKESFERTNFIPQDNVFFDNNNDQKIYSDINLRLRGMFGETSLDNNYKKALEELDKKIRMLLPRSSRSGGNVYERNEQKINNVKALLENSKAASVLLINQSNELNDLNNRKDLNDKSLNELKKQIQILNTLNEKKLRKENYDKDKEALDKVNEALKENTKFFISITPEETNLNKLEEKRDELDSNKKDFERIQSKNTEEINNLRNMQSKANESNYVKVTIDREIKSLKDELKDNKAVKEELNNKVKKINALDIILFIITLGIYLIIFFNKNSKIKKDIEGLEKEIDKLNEKINSLNVELSELAKDSNVNYDDEISKLLKEIELSLEDYRNKELNIKDIFNKYNVSLDDINVAYYKIERTYHDYHKLLKEKEVLEETLKEYDLSEFDNLKLDNNLNHEELLKKERDLNDIKESLIREINTLEKDILFNEDLSNELDDHQGELDILLENRINYDKKRGLLEKTKEILTESNQRLSVKYLAPLEDEINKLIKFFELDDFQIKFDGNSKASLKSDDTNRFHELGYYSTGNQELMSILVRLALVDIIYKDVMNPFLIFDDSFNNFDDQKIKMVKPLLEKLSTRNQIIYFTCSSSRNLE